MLVAAALVLGAIIGWCQPRHALAAVLALVASLGGQMALTALSDLAASTPPILPWEETLATATREGPLWMTGMCAALAAWITSRLVNPPEYQWQQGDPDRRSGRDRRGAPRNSERRAAEGAIRR